MKHLLTIFFLFFCSLSVEAQYTLSTPKEIDVIAVDERVGFTFYHIKEKGDYIAYQLECKEERDVQNNKKYNLSLKEVATIKKPKIKKELEEKGVFYSKDLRSTTYADFNKKKWSLGGGVILSFINTSYIVEQYLEAYKSTLLSFVPIVIQLSKDKCIYLLGKGYSWNRIYNALLPFKDRDELVGCNISGELEAIQLDKGYIADAMGHKDLYFKKPKGDKYELVNILGAKVLPDEYDNVYYSESIFVTENNGKIEVYNLYQDKMDIGDVKAFYLYDMGIEVLKESGAAYYDAYGKKVTELPNLNKGDDCYVITNTQLHIGKLWGEYLSKKRSVVKEMGETITEIHRDKNLYYLRVEKNGYKGLLLCKLTPEEKFTEEELLPIVYDKLYYESNNQFFFEKDNKKGFYPQQKEPSYNGVKKCTFHFYEIEKGGKRGYLDIKTFKEYFFN